MGLLTKLVDKSIDRVMDYVLRNCIIYNVAWEDPRIDGKVMQIGQDDTLLMLTTGGCNVLDRLLDGAKHIVSVDLNVAQNALLELKLAGARALTHEQFFQLFAHSNRKLFDAVYEPRLRPLLSPSAAAFWDTHASFFDNVMYSGASGGLARALGWLAWLFGLQPLIRAFLTCKDLEEQRKVFAANRRKVDMLTTCFNWLLPVFCPFAGVPASQLRLEESSREADASGCSSIIELFFHRIFNQTHIATDNYFYYAYLYGKYSRTCCPRYLQPEYFETLKAAATRVTVKTAFLHEAASEYPDGYFTGMILLDHMDWLSTEQIQQEWAVFSRKLDPATGRVLWRSFAYDTRSVPPLKMLNFNPAPIEQAEAETPDRVGMYNSTHLATLPPNMLICEAPAAPAAAPLPAATRALLIGRMVCAAVAFACAWIAEALLAVLAYVPFAAAAMTPLLHTAGAFVSSALRTLLAATAGAEAAQPTPAGKRSLLQLMPGIQGGSWVDVGCGLGSELSSVASDNVSHYASVRLVALPGSPAAASPAAAPALAKKGPAVHKTVLTAPLADANAIASEMLGSGLSKASADLVTLSHGLVGEADWEARLNLALALLKPGGLLAVCDLAPPSTKASTAYWGIMQPGRTAAPHHAAVLDKLQMDTAEVHVETKAALSPLFSAPTPAHFVYIGRKP